MYLLRCRGLLVSHNISSNKISNVAELYRPSQMHRTFVTMSLLEAEQCVDAHAVMLAIFALPTK